jgi:hypothetical protein
MVQWLQDQAYTTKSHWRFGRMHLWRDEQHFLFLEGLWPDHQTRLSIKALAGGRSSIHCGSPYGGGDTAPVAILHHKFLVKSHAERLAIVERYDSIAQGAGTAFRRFSVPEDCIEQCLLAPVNSGGVYDVQQNALEVVTLKGVVVE